MWHHEGTGDPRNPLNETIDEGTLAATEARPLECLPKVSSVR